MSAPIAAMTMGNADPGAATGSARTGGAGKDISTCLSYADFAAFLLAQLNNPQWVDKAPTISN